MYSYFIRDIYLPENIFIDNMTLDNLSNLTNL